MAEVCQVDDGLDHAIERCLSDLGCPQCGAPVHLLRVLSRRIATAVISTRCAGCGATANRVCFTGDALRQLHQAVAEPQRCCDQLSCGPVDDRDVVSIRHFLLSFDGDFQRLFGLSRQP